MPLAAVAADLAAAGVPDAQAPAFWEAIHDNLHTRADIADWWAICAQGATPLVEADDAEFVKEALATLPAKPWDGETWGAWTGALKATSGRKGKSLFMPLRKALTGRGYGPDMSKFMPLLQKV